MRLFIAEKPSVAKAIAEAIGLSGKGEGFLECGNDKITWCFGHLLEQAEPDEYTSNDIPMHAKSGKKIWRIEDLPIIPETWNLKPKTNAQKQLAVIKTLLKETDEVVNAGDADREGQLLIDEVLDYFGNKKKVLRFWVSAHDSFSLKKGLGNLKDNSNYLGFGEAAKARAQADWLIGMNLSRAFTLKAQRSGSPTLLTVGRVQTPTLSMVVARDRIIENFKSIPYYHIRAVIQHENGVFVAQFKPNKNTQGLDEEGHLVNVAAVEQLISKISNRMGAIRCYKQTPKTIQHPKAYSLSDLTLHASNRFGLSAEEVLKGAQSLYETHKLITYPRTDCSYLPESQHQEAIDVLRALKKVNPELSELIINADPSIKSATWNDKKITAHFGMIPTRQLGNKSVLSSMELQLYELIVKAYIAQFYPLHEYLSTEIDIEIEAETLTATGNTVINPGWKTVFEESKEERDLKAGDTLEQSLPTMVSGDEITCLKAVKKDLKTTAPKSYTEGTLIRAMENIHQAINDTSHKKLLKEGDGIGTPATRATIISELKRRGYLTVEGKKNIKSTLLGRSIIDALPETVKSPIVTAIYERSLQQIENDPSVFKTFVDKQIEFVKDQIEKSKSGFIQLEGIKNKPQVSEKYLCQICQKGLIRRPGKKGFWWSCSGYPNCKQSYPDIKGQPNYTIKKEIIHEK